MQPGQRYVILPAHGQHQIVNMRQSRGPQALEDHFECRPNIMAVDNRSRQPGQDPVHLFAVYDGHTTDAVSKHCAAKLHLHLRAHMQQHLEAGATLDHAAQAGLKSAFADTDAELKRMGVAAASGSTATVALVTPSSILLAFCGDSRAVMTGAAGDVATQDHKATREDELDRVEAAGGKLLNAGGELRVMGMLACTRSIGDHDLQEFGVTAEPEVIQITRSEQDQYLIIASDGLWDKFSNQEAVHYSRELYKREASLPPNPSAKTCLPCRAAHKAAYAMANKARKGRQSRDDITVLVVNLHQACTCNRSVGAHNMSTSSIDPKEDSTLAVPHPRPQPQASAAAAGGAGGGHSEAGAATANAAWSGSMSSGSEAGTRPAAEPRLQPSSAEVAAATTSSSSSSGLSCFAAAAAAGSSAAAAAAPADDWHDKDVQAASDQAAVPVRLGKPTPETPQTSGGKNATPLAEPSQQQQQQQEQGFVADVSRAYSLGMRSKPAKKSSPTAAAGKLPAAGSPFAAAAGGGADSAAAKMASSSGRGAASSSSSGMYSPFSSSPFAGYVSSSSGASTSTAAAASGGSSSVSGDSSLQKRPSSATPGPWGNTSTAPVRAASGGVGTAATAAGASRQPPFTPYHMQTVMAVLEVALQVALQGGGSTEAGPAAPSGAPAAAPITLHAQRMSSGSSSTCGSELLQEAVM